MTGTAVTFGTLDWAVVALYFVANTAICVWAALKKEKDTADYFLASRSAGWFLIGSSIFASNIGAEKNPQAAFPTLVSNLLPIGLRGLVLAGMLSGLMSALASLFNSTATLFTVDFYKRLRLQSSEQHLVRVGRIATAAVVVVGMIWIPIMQSMSKQLYSYLQLVQPLLAPGIAAVFMAGIFSRRVTPISGLVGLATGFALGMLRLLLQALHQSGGIEWSGLIQDFVDVDWLYFSFLLFVFTCATIWVVSQFTPKASPEQLAGLTWSSVSEQRRPPNLWFLGDIPYVRDRRDHCRHLHLLLVTAPA